ncbi:hypothetical protein EIP86_006313 [Pleurotus ostreatoroseus]|nr:hypothetical protein EIP86_006313 [Pleurotus ostreatoroseus]
MRIPIHIVLILQVRDLYKDLVALEREFATKLQQLSRKAADKKAKKMAATVFGTTPTTPYDDKTLSQSTLERAYNQLITSIGDSAQDHFVLADALTSQVIDVLRTTEKKHEETNKRQMQFYQKMLSDREKAYTDRLKSKEKYDAECVEVETYRQKQERSSDDRHAERAARQYEQQQSDMLNSKNVYILSTALANSAKSKYFGEDLPAFEDVSSLSLKSRVASVDEAFRALNPAQDQTLFIEHNVSHFAEPPDWSFEPCSTHYDTDDMSVEPVPKVYLQNRLSKCKDKLQEIQAHIALKRKEVDQLQKLIQTYTQDRSLGDPDTVADNYLEADHQLTFFTTSERTLLAEIETISSALGGDEGAQCPHTFKSSSFSIPTQCAYCKSSIWGLSKQGKTCKSCGISVHNKCELKVPADCPGSKGSRHTSSPSISTSYTSLSRSGSRGMSNLYISGPFHSLAELSAPSSAASALTSPSTSSIAQSERSSTQEEESYPVAQVVFDFTPTSPFELSVKGKILCTLEVYRLLT